MWMLIVIIALVVVAIICFLKPRKSRRDAMEVARLSAGDAKSQVARLSAGDAKSQVARLSAGDAKSQNILGIYFYYGIKVSQNFEKAVERFENAAAQGYTNAYFNLGVCYYKGNGAPQDKEKAIDWWTKAAKEGHSYAQNNLGVCYHNGEGVEQDYVKSILWLSPTREGIGYEHVRCRYLYWNYREYVAAVKEWVYAVKDNNEKVKDILKEFDSTYSLNYEEILKKVYKDVDFLQWLKEKEAKGATQTSNFLLWCTPLGGRRDDAPSNFIQYAEGYGAIINDVEREADKSTDQYGLGRCHVVWGEMQRILKERYDIDWLSPADENPDTLFD